MSRKILDLVIKATDKATPTLKQVEGGSRGGGVRGVTSALKGMINPASMATAGLASLSAVAVASVRKWQQTAMEVGNLADSLQLTAEDASTLQSVMNKFDITNDTMIAVFRKMNREGLAPTLDNLVGLLKQYDSITDSTEKMQFAQEMFGEQGIKQIIPMWERLTDAQKNNFAQSQDNLNMTQEQIDKARELAEAQEELSAGWQRLVGESTVLFLRLTEVIGDAYQELYKFLGLLNESPDYSRIDNKLSSLSSPDYDKEESVGYDPTNWSTQFWRTGAYKRGRLKSSLEKVDDEPTPAYKGFVRTENKKLAKDIARELGTVLKNEDIRDAQMLNDIRRLLRGLPMTIRDATARTEI